MSYMDVPYSEEKFTELVLHIADRLKDDRPGGATKLDKVLFLVEFTQLRRHHRVVSGCEFKKLTHGPTPCQLASVRSGLVASGDALLLDEDFLGRPQQRLIPKREADLSLFTADELRTIDDVLSQLAGMSGTQLSELAAQEPGWRLSEVGETIPFSTAFLDFPQVSTPTSRRLSESVAERYRFVAAG